MSATMENIGEFLSSDKWSPSEKWVIKWQFRLLGDFETALANAIKLADDNNLRRLRLVFPTQVDGFSEWFWGDLAERLRADGLDI